MPNETESKADTEEGGGVDSSSVNLLSPPLLFIPFVNISVILSLLQYIYFLLSEFCLSLFFRDAGGDEFWCDSFRE